MIFSGSISLIACDSGTRLTSTLFTIGSVTALRDAATTAPTAPCDAAPTTRPTKSCWAAILAREDAEPLLGRATSCFSQQGVNSSKTWAKM